MLSNQRTIIPTNRDNQDHEEEEHIRDIPALTTPRPPSATRPRTREAWETSSHRSSSLSTASDVASIENFSTMSREFNALVVAGSTIGNMGSENYHSLNRIGEEEPPEEETNPLAIVPDNSPLGSLHSPTPRHGNTSTTRGGGGGNHGEVSMQSVKKEEVETKINAWQTAKVCKINNRFKREECVINGWESEEVQKGTSWMKKVERKLEEKRAKALEKMQNDIAKARRKAEEKRASAEAKRGTKVAKVLEIANLMRAVGRAPAKRSFF